MRALNPFISITVLLLSTIALSSCVKNTSIQQYTLENTVQTASRSRDSGDLGMVLIGPITMPGQYFGKAIVTRSGTTVVKSSTTRLWAAPLDEQIATLVSRQLKTLLQSDNVAVYPGPRFADRAFQLELVIDRFSGSLGQEFSCELTWTINDLQTRKIVRRGNFSLTVPLADNSYQQYVAAASAVIGRFSAVLAPAFAELATNR